MVSDNLGDDIPIGIGGVGVFPGEVAGVHVKASAESDSVVCGADGEGGNLVAEAVGEERNEIDAALRNVHSVVGVAQKNVVVGVAGDELVQKGGSEVGSEASDKTGGWAGEIGVGEIGRASCRERV